MKMAFVQIVIMLAGLMSLAQEPVAATNEVVERSMAAKLYEQALSERESGNVKQAIQTVAKIVAEHTDDRDVLPNAELLSAELYLELDLIECADVTAQQVVELYEGTDVADKAAALRAKIEELKADKESEGSTE